MFDTEVRLKIQLYNNPLSKASKSFHREMFGFDNTRLVTYGNTGLATEEYIIESLTPIFIRCLRSKYDGSGIATDSKLRREAAEKVQVKGLIESRIFMAS